MNNFEPLIIDSEQRAYFTSDLHFGHDKSFLYEPRGFQTIQEHDEKIINNWNDVVAPDDIVILLGDLVMNTISEDYGISCLKRLNGNKYLVFGNHDSLNKIIRYETECNIKLLGYSYPIKRGKYTFWCSHYPVMINNYPPESKKFCLHGHTHHNDKLEYIQNGCYNVNLDAHNNFPVCLNTILDDLRDVKANPMDRELYLS